VENAAGFLRQKLSADNYDRLMAIANPKMHAFVAEAIELANPAEVVVFTDSKTMSLQCVNGQPMAAAKSL